MSLIVAIENWTPDQWIERFRRLAPDLEVIDAREPFDPEAVRFAAVWKPKPGLLARLPNLQAIFNLGAGVDALLGDPTLPDVPVVRIVDPDLTARMTEWVVMNVLAQHRRMDHHRANQARAVWEPIDQPAAHAVTVGLMGLGVLGRDAAEVLRRLGFRSRRLEPLEARPARRHDLRRHGRAAGLPRPHRHPRRAAAGDAGHARPPRP